MLTTLLINVDTNQDVIDGGDGLTSLREAIIQANSSSDDEVIINLPAQTFTLGIQASGPDDATTGDLNITNTDPTIEIRGAGAGSTVIDFRDLGSGFSSRVFDVAAGTHLVEISGVTLRGDANGDGGAVFNAGNLEIDNAIIENSVASGRGGAVFNDNGGSLTLLESSLQNNMATLNGGAVFNDGSLTVARAILSDNVSSANGGQLAGASNGFTNIETSTFSGNGGSTNAVDGGAIHVDGGFLSLTTSRLMNHVASNQGGGLFADGGAQVVVTRSTIDGNIATDTGGGLHNASGSVSLQNTTVSGNTANASGAAGGGAFNAATGNLDLLHATVAFNSVPNGAGGGIANQSGGSVIVTNTIIADNTAGGANPDTDGAFQSLFDNIVETPGAATGFNTGNGDQFADPILVALADNGGNTPTHALGLGSPAIDSGTLIPGLSDQRGVPRPEGLSADIGAFEDGFQGLFVTTTNDVVDCGDGVTSLREAVIAVNQGSTPIIIVPAGQYSLTRTGVEAFNGTFNDLDITAFGVQILGSGQLSTVIDASGLGGAGGTGDGRVFENSGFGTVLSNLTIENGDAGSVSGGGIASFGALTLNSVTVEDNTAFDGGGIFAFGALTLNGTVVTDNTASNLGGGLLLQGSDPDLPVIRSSSISHNTAGNAGGGIVTLGKLTVEDSFIAHNMSGSDGGGIAVDGMSGGSLEIRNSFVRSNTATGNGGGIATAGDTEIVSTEIDSNVAMGNAGGVGSTAGQLTIAASTIKGNVASGSAGGVGLLGAEGEEISEMAGDLAADISFSSIQDNTASLDGGGIANLNGTLTLRTSTLSGNSATNGGGLANSLGGSVDVVSSTFSGNSASGVGGGVVNESGTVDVTNATITLNSASSGGGLASLNNAPTFVQNTISFGNTLMGGVGADVFSATVITSGGNNVIGTAGFGFADGVNGDQVGVNPMLGLLQNNGGATETHALLSAGSPAVDAGSNSHLDPGDAESDVDQRGAERILNGGTGTVVDVGAFEFGSNAIFVTTTFDVVDGGDGLTSLREAIDQANAAGGPDTIVLPAGKYELTLLNAGGTENGNVSGDLDITDDVTIVGYGMGVTIIDGQASDRIFDIAPGQGGVTATFLDMTVQNGQATSGGGLRAESSTTTLKRVEVADNRATSSGGGIDNSLGAASLIVIDSLLRNNQASDGGAIFTLADPLTVQGSRFENNVALMGDGGAIVSLDAVTSISGSQFLQNSAATTGQGGAIFTRDFGGAADVVTISDTRFSGNFAGSGGAISIRDQIVNVTNSEFADLSDEGRFISSNQATDADGGAIENIGGTLSVQESRFRGNSSAGFGGAIINAGPGAILTLEGSVLEGNFAGAMGGGGGLYTDQTATVKRTTFSMNSADIGGAIGNAGTLTLQNSTLSGNTATSGGGGLGNLFAGNVTVEFSTLTGNQAFSGGGGGILQNGNSVSLRNTVVALNTSGTQINADVQGAFTSNGNNLISDVHDSTGFPGSGDLIAGNAPIAITSFDVDGSGNISVTTSVNHNLLSGEQVRITDTDASTGIPEAHGRFTITVVDMDTFTLDGAFSSAFGQSFMENSEAFLLLDPQLGLLQNNTTPPDPPAQGGPSMGGAASPDEIAPIDPVIPQTHRPLFGSPVIDAGIVVGGITTDQRGLGFPRNVNGDNAGGAAPDIGAVELFLTSVSGRKFDDVNGNGIDDPGEPGIPGVTIFADYNVNGIFDSGDPFTETDFNGDYILDLVLPLQIVIGEVVPLQPPGLPLPATRQTFPFDPLANSFSLQLDSVPTAIPRGVTTADLDGNGLLDVIYTRSAEMRVTVLLQQPGGAFTSLTSIVGSTPIGVIAADFDNDGFLDIATANRASDSVTLLRNPGNGHLVNIGTVSVGTGPESLVAGDFNGDGNLDLAVANVDSDNVTILTGDGMGGFIPLATPSVGDRPVDVVVGDVDRDGLLDLATADEGSDQVTLLLNQGGGVFVPSVIPLPNSDISALDAGDFDRDGLLDLAVARPGAGVEDVAVILNRGSLTSFQILSVGSVTDPTDVRAVDIDGDGFLDVAATSGLSSNNLILFRNDQSGGFAAGGVSTTGDQPVALAIGDVSGDGRPDFVTANFSSDDVSLGRNFTGAHVTNLTTGVVTSGINFGNQLLAQITGTKFDDVNADGVFQQDTLNFLDDFNSGSPDGSWQNEVGNWRVTNGEYEAANPGNIPLTYNSLPFTLVDFEVEFDVSNVNDGGVFLRSTPPFPGSTDLNGVLLVTRGGTDDLYWHIVQNGNAGAVLNPVGGLFNTGDDIHLRVVVEGTNYSVFVNGSTTPATTLDTGLFLSGNFALYSNSAQTFDNVDLSDVPNPESGVAGIEVFLDLNDNGRQDPFEPTRLTVADDPNTPVDETGQFLFDDVVPGDVRVYENVPPGFTQTTPNSLELSAAMSLGAVGDNAVASVVADFDGDGINDLAVISNDASGGTLRVFDGTRSQHVNLADTEALGGGAVVEAVAAGDLDGDGDLDIAVVNSTNRRIVLYENTGALNFTQAALLATAGAEVPADVVLADVNQDGELDVVAGMTASSNAGVELFTNNGSFPGSFSFNGVVSLITNAGDAIAVVDLDNDGDVDIAALDRDQDEIELFENVGGVFSTAGTVSTGSQPVALAVADFDQDGRNDLAIGRDGTSSGSAIESYLATSPFQYGSNQTFVPGFAPDSLTVADLDNDRNNELLFADPLTGQIVLLPGSMTGLISSPVPFQSGVMITGLSTGDLDGDGLVDVVGVEGVGAASARALFNRFGSVSVSAASGMLVTIAPIGNVELATVSGTKFHDLDGDGIQDMGEPGLPGFTIYIDENENGRLDLGEIATVTDEDGMYSFTGVTPAQTIRIREVQQSGFTQTEPDTFLLDAPLTLPVDGGSRSSNIGDVIASGDFDGDGLAEIVSTNPGADSVSVIGFQGVGVPNRVDLSVGMTPLTVRVADLNGDGNLDIVTANNGSDNVSVILGNGDGTFQASSQFAAGTRPQSLTIADVDGGGTPDVVVSSDSSSNLQVLSNNGAGVLAAPVVVPVVGVTSGEDIESGDFDMDGNIDLAVVSAIQNRVSILLNTGGGSFGAATPVAVGMFPLGTAVGDFDEDGDLDLTVTNTSDSTIQILTNNGSGTFTPGAATSVGGSPEAVVVGDVNNDGHLDVVAANQVQSDVNILLGDGMGGFAVSSGMIGASQDGVALDDLNGDGRLDILTETFGLGSVTALLNLTGTRIVTPSAGEMVSGVDFGNFALPGEISGTKYDDLNENGVRDMGEPGLPGFTIFLDFDNDDVLDGGEPMTVTGADGSFTFTGVNPLQNYTVSEVQQPGFVQLAPNDPGFAFSGDVLAGASAAGIVTGDFDGQFGEDMAVTLESSNQVAVILRQANGTFGAPTLVAVGNQPFAIVSADFDGVNGPDLAVANEADGTVTILTNNGTGVFTPQSPMAVSSFPVDLAVADVDGMDGPDLVIANNANNSFQIALNNGMGMLTPQTPVGAGVAPSSVAVADYDGDGDQDVALTTAADNRLTVFLQTSPLVFVGQAPIVTGADPSRLRSIDLNSDLTPDLVVVNQQSGDVTVVLNNSSGGTLNLAAPVNFLTGVAGESLALVDLTRDGAPEIVVTGEDDEQLSVLNNDGLGGFSPPTLFPLDGTFPVEVAPIQLNADGDFDLVLTDAEFGEVTLLTSTVGSHSIFLGAGATVSGLEFGNREINDPPTVTAPSTASIAEDTSLTFGMNAISINDPDAGANDVEVVLTTTNGVATLSQTTGLMFSAGANGTSAMTFTGTIPNINAALNDLAFDPTTNFNGAAFLNVSVDDLGNTGFGGPQFDSAQVAITVNAVNDAPMLTVPGGATLNEDGSVVLGAITVADDDIGPGNAEVTLSVSSGILTLPSTAGLSFSMGSNGSPSMTFSGSLGNVNTAINGITYAPDPDFNGADTLFVSVSDLGNTGGPAQMDSDVVSITVNPINDAPVAIVPGTQSATEDTTKLINGLSVVDIDAQANDVRATLTAGNGTITVDASVPSGLQAGDITGNGTSSVVLNGTVMEINLTLGVGITYLGNLNFAGTDSITLLIEDLGSTGETPVNPLQDSDSFDVNVSAVNDAPVLNGVPVPVLDYTENDAATVLASTATVTDVDDTHLTSATVDFTANFQMLEDVLTADVSGTSIGASFDSETGVLQLTGADTLANYQQVLRTVTYQNISEDPSQLRRTVRFVVNDGSASSVPQLRDIDVTSVNDAPTFDSQTTAFVLAEHSMAGTAVHSVLASDVDSPAFLTFSIVSGNTNSAFAIDSITGQITVNDPGAVDFEGVGTFNLLVRVTDANPITPTPLSADQTFTINLTDIAEPFNVGSGAFSTGAVTLVRDGAFLHARLTGTMTDAVPKAAFANVTNVLVQARDGSSDELTVDLSGGDPIPLGGVSYDGGSGAGTDSLVLTGGTVGTVNHTLQDPNSGTIDIDGDGIVYTGLEPVTDLLIATNRAFFYDAGDDIVTLSDGLAPADGQSRLTAPSAETVDFRNPTGTLLVSLGAGNDIFRTVSADSALDASVSVLGEAGNDDISATGFTAGGVTIDGGDDDDVLGGSPGQDAVMGGNGNDQFLSSPGNDMMDGGAGNDFLNDQIDDGDDDFEGGAGFDSIFLNSPTVNEVAVNVNGPDSGSLAAISPMGTSVVNFSGTEDTLIASTIQQDLSVDYSAILTATNLTLAEGEGAISLTGMGLVGVTAFSIGDDLVIDGSRGDDTTSIIGLSSFDAGIEIRGGTGIDRVVVPAGLPAGGLDSDIIFSTEASDITGLLKSNGGQVQLDGDVTLLGNTTIDATTTILGGGVTTGANTLTVEGNTQLNGALSTFSGTFQLNGDLSSSMAIVIQGPTFNVTGDATFLGRVTQAGITTFGGEATFSAPLLVGGSIIGGSDTLRLQSQTQLADGEISTSGLIEVGVNPMGQGDPPALSGDGSIQSNNLLVLDGAILAPMPIIDATATQFEVGATLDLTDLNEEPQPTPTLLVATDSLNLGGANLIREEGETLPFISQLLIDKESEGAISGTFNGLPEGAAFDVTVLGEGLIGLEPVGIRRYAITYQSGDGNDVGIFPVASISGLVFEDDSPENGTREDMSEARVQGVMVDLLDDQGTTLRQTTTAADGTYTFADLLAGNYRVRFTAPDSQHFADRNVGTDDTIDSDPNVLTGEVVVPNLMGGEDRQNVDAGLIDTTISISDPAPINEGNGNPVSLLTFEVTLNGRSPHQVTVNALVAAAVDQELTPATIGQDVTPFQTPGGILPVVFNPGQTTQTVTVSIVGDLNQEPDEGFEVRLSNPVQAALVDDVALGIIRNDDFAAPTIVFGNDVSIVEGQFPSEPLLELTINLEGGTVNEDLFISYNSIDPLTTPQGVATPGVDFRAVDDVAVIPAGLESVTIQIPIIGDSDFEPDETFDVVLTDIDGGEMQGVSFGGRTVARGTIINDDVFVPEVSIGDAFVSERNSPAKSTLLFPVTLSGPASTDTRIAFSTTQLSGDGTATEGLDYLPAGAEPLFIPQGQVSGTIAVTVLGDQIDEDDEVLAVELGDILEGNVTIAEALAVGTIGDDDDPILRASIDPTVSVTEGPSGRVTSFTMTVRLSGDALVPIELLVSTLPPDPALANAATPGVDFVALTSRRVRIEAGRRSATFKVDVLGDGIFEPDEVLLTQIIGTAPGTPANIVIDAARSTATGTIVDDDNPTPVVSIASTASTTETRTGLTTAVSIPVRLSSPPTQEVRVDFATVTAIPGVGIATDIDDPMTPGREDDFRARNGTLTFAPGQQVKFIQILVNGDDLVEPPETFAVDLTGISGNAVLDAIATRNVSTIFDDDVAIPFVSIAPTARVTEPDGDGVVPVDMTVTLGGRVSQDVIVGYSIPNVMTAGAATAGSDYVAVTRDEVTIEAGQTTATITVLVTGDNIAENEERFFVQLDDVAPLPDGTVIAQLDQQNQQTEITIDDNDAAVPTVLISDATVFEGDPVAADGVAPVDDPRLDFTISLSSVPTGPVSVEVETVRFENAAPGVANTDGPNRDVFATRRILFFDATITSQTFSVRVEPDFEFEADELVFIRAFNPIGALLAPDLQGVGIVANDDVDRPTVSITSVSLLEGDLPGENVAVLEVTLDADPAQGTIPAVSVGFRTLPISATENVDYTPVNGELTFAEGVRSQTVEIPIIGDLVNEGPEEFFVELFDLNNGQDIELNPEAFQGIVTIRNDDAPQVRFQIDNVRQREGTGGTTEFVFTVRRTGNSAQASTVQFATSAGTAEAGDDFVGRSGTLTFTPDGPDTQTVTITVVGDDQLEEEFETFFVTLSNPTNASIVAGAGQGTGTVLDDDQRVFSADANAALEEIARELRERFAGAALNDPAVTAYFEEQLLAFADKFGIALLGIILDPVDFLLTDLESRTVGYTEAAGEISEVPRAFYSGDGNVELVVIPAAEQGVYGLQLSGVDTGEFRSTATLVTADGFTKTISNVDTLSGDVELALDFTEEDALPLRGEVAQQLADRQQPSQQPVQNNSNLAIADDVAAAIDDVVLPDDLLAEPPPDDGKGPIDRVIGPIGELLRGLGDSLASQMDPLPDLAPENPETEKLLDEVYSGLGQQAFGAPGDLLLDLIDLLTEFGKNDDSESESEGETEAADPNENKNNPEADDGNAALERLLESRRIAKAQREALLWLEKRRRAEVEAETESKEPAVRPATDEPRAEANSPAQTTASAERNPDSRDDGAASEENPEEEA